MISPSTTTGSNFNYPSDVTYVFVWVALYLTITHSTCSTSCPNIIIIELFRNVSVHEFYRLKVLITSTLEQVITSVVQKKNNIYEPNFKVYWQSRIEDRGSRIS